MACKIARTEPPFRININLASEVDARMFSTTRQMGTFFRSCVPAICTKYDVFVHDRSAKCLGVASGQGFVAFLIRTEHAIRTFGVYIQEMGVVDRFFVRNEHGFVNRANIETRGRTQLGAIFVDGVTDLAEDLVRRNWDNIECIVGDERQGHENGSEGGRVEHRIHIRENVHTL